MRIGVVSDTHNNLVNVRRIVDLFNQARVERVVHTGDITQAKTLRALGELAAPLFGVFGNNDEREALRRVGEELGITLGEPPLVFHWAERKIVVVHDPRELAGIDDAYDVALHGHTHERVIRRTSDRLVFNPGECAGHLLGHNAVGIVDLGTLEAEILLF